MYGPWLRAEHSGNLLFVNTPAKKAVLQDFDKSRKIFELQQTFNFATSESLNKGLKITLAGEDKTDKDIQNAAETCQEFGLLK